MDRVHFIINPASAGGKTAERWMLMRDLIRSYFKEYRYIFTEKPLQAREITRDLLQRGYDLIIGVGGDGTLNEILNGFFCPRNKSVLNDRASLGFLASGTGTDFNRLFRVPRDLKLTLSGIKNAVRRPIDIGKIIYRDTGNRESTRFFINVADFGMGAEVVSHLQRMVPSKRNSFAYYRALLSVLRGFTSRKARIELDDGQMLEGKFLIGAIANGKSFGGGMRIAPHADISDGFLDLILIRHMSRPRIIYNSFKLYTGTIHRHPLVSSHRIRNLDFHENEFPCMECDGELIRGRPRRVETLERALNLRI